MKKFFIIIFIFLINICVINISAYSSYTNNNTNIYSDYQIQKANDLLRKVDNLIYSKKLNKIEIYNIFLNKISSSKNKILNYLLILIKDRLSPINSEISTCNNQKHLWEEQTTSSLIYANKIPVFEIVANKEWMTQTWVLLEINEWESVFFKANILFIDTNEYISTEWKKMKPYPSFFWADDSIWSNFCLEKDSNLQKVRWKAPQVDSDMYVTVSAEFMDNAGHVAFATFPIKVKNSNNSKPEWFKINDISTEKDPQFSGKTYFNVKLNSSQKIDKIEYTYKIPEWIETCCWYSNKWWDSYAYKTIDNYYVQKKSDTEYFIEINQDLFTFYWAIDFKLRLYNDKNVYAEKEILNVPLKQTLYKIYSSFWSDKFKSKIWWVCISDNNINKDISCWYKYVDENNFTAQIDWKYYKNNNLYAYVIIQDDSNKSIRYEPSKYKFYTKLSNDELKSQWILYWPFKVNNAISWGSFEIK